jgi:hypothetical protein
MGDDFREIGSICSVTDAMTSLANPELDQPPSITTKRPVFRTDSIITLGSNGLSTRISMVSALIPSDARIFATSEHSFAEYPAPTRVTCVPAFVILGPWLIRSTSFTSGRMADSEYSHRSSIKITGSLQRTDAISKSRASAAATGQARAHPEAAR